MASAYETLTGGRQLNQDDERSEAFRVLGEIISQLDAGQVLYAASLKPRLTARIGGFSESELGYASFRAFLREAESRGIARLTDTGKDVVVVPTSESDEAGAIERLEERGSVVTRAPVRQEVWDAFVDWRAPSRRVYEPESGRVLVFSDEPSVAASREENSARDDFRKNPSAFVPIDPVTQETQLTWMREFAEGIVDTNRRTVLRTALGASKPIPAFGAALRTMPDLWAVWRRTVGDRVTAAIATWASEHELSYEALRRSSVSSVLDDRREGGAQINVNLEEVRALAHRAIDRMSAAELLELPIRLGRVVER
jgi:hypothetical protein